MKPLLPPAFWIGLAWVAAFWAVAAVLTAAVVLAIGSGGAVL